jgi:2-polyprenyl-3-methyl-5-hydroxy-6-metoxy-1,4-benzoquinol methylase
LDEGYYNEDYYSGKTSNYGKLWGYNSVFSRLMTMWRCRSVVKLIRKHRPETSSLLDVGCAFGVTTDFFVDQGFICVGLDISSYAINYAKEHVKNACFCHGDIQEKTPFKDKGFDVIVALDILEHIKRLREVLLELRRVLSHTGLMVISVPFEQELDRDKSHCWMMSYSDWSNMFEKAGFEIIDVKIHPTIFRLLGQHQWTSTLLILRERDFNVG